MIILQKQGQGGHWTNYKNERHNLYKRFKGKNNYWYFRLGAEGKARG